jgi:hypothetical protein
MAQVKPIWSRVQHPAGHQGILSEIDNQLSQTSFEQRDLVFRHCWHKQGAVQK